MSEVKPAQRDVFVSYGHADAEWVRTLAGNLYQSGVEVAFDEWEIGPGDVLIHKLDEMLLTSRDGILVVSPASLRSRYVQREYAALMQRSIERGRRLIPVLLQDAELPPLLSTEIWVDFRNVDGPDYLARVQALVAVGLHQPDGALAADGLALCAQSSGMRGLAVALPVASNDARPTGSIDGHPPVRCGSGPRQVQ
jgi:TIR domain